MCHHCAFHPWPQLSRKQDRSQLQCQLTVPCMYLLAQFTIEKIKSRNSSMKHTFSVLSWRRRPFASALSLPFRPSCSAKCFSVFNRPTHGSLSLKTVTALCLHTHLVSLCFGSSITTRPASSCTFMNMSCRTDDARTKQCMACMNLHQNFSHPTWRVQTCKDFDKLRFQFYEFWKSLI